MTWLKNKLDSPQNQQYYLQNGHYTICKVCLSGKWIYELWKREGNKQGEFIATGKLEDLKNFKQVVAKLKGE